MLFAAFTAVAAQQALAQEGSVLTSLQSQITTAAKGWETTVMDAARSLFWILATIEIGIAAVWLAIQSASLDSWFAELVRRIMFVGFFAFVLAQGPSFAKAVVDSLFQIGAGEGRRHQLTFSTPVSQWQRKCRRRYSSVFSRTMRWQYQPRSRWS